MDLTQNLVAYWDMEQNLPLFGPWDRVGQSHLNVQGSPVQVDGISKKGAEILPTPTSSPSGLWIPFTNTLSHQSQAFHFNMWVKFLDPLGARLDAVVLTNGEYGITLEQIGTNFHFRADIADVTLILTSLTVVPGRFYLVSIGWNSELQYAFLNVNLRNVVTGLKTSLTPNTGGNFQFGNSGVSIFHKLNAVIDEIAFWRGRMLDWLELSFYFNDGLGRSFAELQPAAECVSIECCETV